MRMIFARWSITTAMARKRCLRPPCIASAKCRWSDALAYVKGLRRSRSAAISPIALLKRLDTHDIPLRELEYCTYTFDLLMDQGAYAEFKRHRMMTQTAQRFTTRLGYAMPRSSSKSGLGSKYETAMRAAAGTFEKLHDFSPEIAQYVVPNAYNRRVLARFNLRGGVRILPVALRSQCTFFHPADRQASLRSHPPGPSPAHRLHAPA